MNDFKVKIRKTEKKRDLTIIYKDDKRELHEIQVFKENFLKALGYFSKKRNEINYQNMIYIEENISFELFNDFISSIETSEISLNDSNYEQYLYLSQKYEYNDLRREIEEFIGNRPDVKSTINDLISSQKVDSIDYIKETIIAKNFDISIKSGLLNKLPIEILVKILTSPNRQIKDYHLLHSFIISVIKKQINENKRQTQNNKIEYFTILPSYLDFNEMTASEIEELLKLENEIDIFLPKNPIKRIKSLISNEDEMKKKISELESKFNEIERKVSNMEESQTLQSEISNRKIDEIQERLSKIEKHIEMYIENSEETENKLKKDIEDHKTNQEMRIINIEKSLQSLEIIMKLFELKCSITADVKSNQLISGMINIDGEEKVFDRNRSKYILNTNSQIKLNENEYETGKEFTSLNQKFEFKQPQGTYYLHTIIYNKIGHFEEFISQPLTIKKISVFTFNYTGCVQSILLEKGKYKLEVWGAEGGQNNTKAHGAFFKNHTGKGGYSSGILNLAKETTLYIYVGGSSTTNSGGWNGGGSSFNTGGAGGGGSTDISLYGDDGSHEWNSSKHLNSRIIVAGGGGGSSLTSYAKWKGGCGGGLNGENNGYGEILGGSEDKGYKFGIGESNSNQEYANAGGGGGWYGGFSCNNDSWWGHGGGGGSGFVYSSSTSSKYPIECMLDSSFYLDDSKTICGNQDLPKIIGEGLEKGHQGNGYAKITFL